MKKVSLSQALKIKKRLVGEVNELWGVLERENSRRNDTPSKVDVKEVYNKYLVKQTELIDVKSVIANANVGIYAKLAEMSELKSQLTHLDLLNTKEGEQVEFVWAVDKREQVKYNWESFINNEKRDTLKRELQDRINALQDEVDFYNNKTEVEIK